MVLYYAESNLLPPTELDNETAYTALSVSNATLYANVSDLVADTVYVMCVFYQSTDVETYTSDWSKIKKIMTSVEGGKMYKYMLVGVGNCGWEGEREERGGEEEGGGMESVVC